MSVPENAPQQNVQSASPGSAVLILPGRASWRPETAVDLENFAPDLIETVRTTTALDLVEICRRQTKDLNPLPVAEPVSYALNYAYARELLRRGIRIDALAGYSLGEFAALALAQAIDFETGLALARARAEEIAAVIAQNPLRMVRIEGADAAAIVEICDDYGDVWPATFDSPSQMIVGGEPRALDRVAPKFKEAGAERIVLVMNNGGLHTGPMRPAHEAMAEHLATVEISKPKLPVASSISAQFEDDPARWRELLADQVHSPVRWYETVLALPEGPPLVEAGGDKLVALALQLQPERQTFVVNSLASVNEVAKQLSGAIAAQ